MSRTQWTRREVLKAGAAAVALPALVHAGALGLEGAAPSETVRVGVIGCGGRAHLIKEGADVPAFRVVAAADCELPKARNYVKAMSGGAKWGCYADFRQMIEKEKLDAVMVETTTHARAWIAIHAMQMGMDVYIEKPMCLTIAEGRYMVNAARRYKKVTQVGTLRFPAAAFGPAPAGYRRSFVLKTDSYCKDMDLYTACGETVEPLPFHAMRSYPYGADQSYPDTDATRRYRRTYNTRQVLGR